MPLTSKFVAGLAQHRRQEMLDKVHWRSVGHDEWEALHPDRGTYLGLQEYSAVVKRLGYNDWEWAIWDGSRKLGSRRDTTKPAAEAEVAEAFLGLLEKERAKARDEAKAEKKHNPSLSIPVSKGFGRFRLETKLVRSRKPPPRVVVTSPSIAVDAIRKIEGSDRERLMAIYLDSTNAIIGIQQVSVGERSAGMVPPDVIARAAILSDSGGVILVHNHPSGSPTPSPEDVGVAKRMKEALGLLGIPLLDMVVLGEDGRFESLQNRGQL